MKSITPNTPLSDLTVGDLVKIIRTAMDAQPRTSSPETVSGIDGIARIFDVSTSTAKRIKKSGVISKAITQKGRVITTDVELARQLWARSAQGRITV